MVAPYEGSPRKWKGLLKRAEACDLEFSLLRASFDTSIRAIWSPLRPGPTSPLSGMEHGCLQCSLGFLFPAAVGRACSAGPWLQKSSLPPSGRLCMACNTLYASQARLKTHLLSSAKCRKRLGQAPVQAPVHDSAQGHVQAPAVSLGAPELSPPVEPEMCRALFLALQGVEVASDQDILDLVSSFVEPWTVLRATVCVWADSLDPGLLLDAVSDFLLVFHPEHLCDRVGGRTLDAPRVLDFQPRIEMPLYNPSRLALPVFWWGIVDPEWLAAWDLLGLDLVRVALADLPCGACKCSGLYICFPAPPCHDHHFLQPGSKPLKALRAQREWTTQLLSSLHCLLCTAVAGVPVFARIPLAADQLEPLSSWLCQVAQKRAEGNQRNCFTLEFNAIGTSV